MQPPTADPRGGLTQQQVVDLIEATNAVTVSSGCELLDQALNVLDDISDDLAAGGSVSRNSYDTLHGKARLAITRELDWGQAIVRPYMVLSDGATSAMFRLGAYFTNTPVSSAGENPKTFQVDGYDILHGLASPVGESYAIEAGRSYLEVVTQILDEQGFTAYDIDQSAAGVLAPTPRAWVLDNNITWLTLVNDMLASIGYQGVWSDWDGRLQLQPYTSPLERSPEWVYDATSERTTIGPDRTMTTDYFEAANRWVFYRNNNVDDVAPVEGNGIYTYVNQDQGPTSVTARNRVWSHVEGLDVADHDSLVLEAQRRIDVDLRLKTTFSMTTFPIPLQWHFDRGSLIDPDLTPTVEVMATSWSLPLDGGDMSLELARLTL